MLSLLRSSPPLAAAGVSVTRCLRGFSRSSASCSDMSKITISGRLQRPPELGTTSSGRQCIRYTIRSWKSKEKTNYFNFLYITDNAKSIEYYTGLPQGSKVVAEGEFSPYRLAREDGTKVFGYSIFSNALHVIERGKLDEEVAGEEVAGEEVTGKEVAGEEVTGKEVAGKEVAGEEVAGKEVAGEEVASEDAQAQPAPAPTEGDKTPEHQASTEGDGTPEHQASAEGDKTPEHQASTEGDGTPEHQASTEGNETPERQAPN